MHMLERKRSTINNLSFHLRKLQKRRKLNSRKQKIRAEIDKIENNKIRTI